MPLGRKNVPIARPHGGTNVFCPAGFLGDDDLIRYVGLVQGTLVGGQIRKNVSRTRLLRK
jgi:hypothetical protein